MTKRYQFIDWRCDNCHAGLDDDEDDREALSVWDAAEYGCQMEKMKAICLVILKKNWKSH